MLINTEDYAKIITKNLRRLALEKGATQRDIARAVGVSPATVSGWMNGKKVPRLSNIEILCDYFGCKRSDIMEPEGKKNREITGEQADLIRIAMIAHPENVTLALELLKRLEGVT